MPPSDGDADLDATGPTMTPSAAAHLPRPSPRGALSLEHYRYESVLGRGGMGEVVLADDLRIGRKVAIKRMRHVASADNDAAARFLREATIQARLEHPAIVPVHEVGRDADDQPYFTMKRLAGTTLADSLARGDRSLREMLRAFIEVCHAIDFAHAKGVVHRDLKRANIMLGDYNEVYVLDWGVARVGGDATTETPLSAPVSGESTTTEVGAVLGTPMYMAPEQGRGDAVTPAADVFALGAVLFEVLAATQLRTKLGVDPDPSPARRAPSRDVPPELDAACIAALAPTPEARPSARELARRVQTYLDGDRDIALRRTQSAQYLADALAAESTRRPERRADAMRLAGQALALDPSSVAAAQLVGRLMLEPPDELPAELAQVLADSERHLVTKQARLAVRVYSIYFLFVPLIIAAGIREWWTLVTVCALVGFSIVWGSKVLTRRGGIIGVLVANAAFIILLARLATPLLVVPAFATGMATALAIYPLFQRRPWIVIVTFVTAFSLPLVFEATGLWARSWALVDGHLQIATLSLGTNAAFVAFVLAASLAAIALPPLFVRAIAVAQRDAQRRVEVQAWHLRQLVPSVSTEAT